MNYTQYLQAIKTLNLWAKHYYILDDPIASDEQYDTLYHQIKQFETKKPNQKNTASPDGTQPPPQAEPGGGDIPEQT